MLQQKSARLIRCFSKRKTLIVRRSGHQSKPAVPSVSKADKIEPHTTSPVEVYQFKLIKADVVKIMSHSVEMQMFTSVI